MRFGDQIVNLSRSPAPKKACAPLIGGALTDWVMPPRQRGVWRLFPQDLVFWTVEAESTLAKVRQRRHLDGV